MCIPDGRINQSKHNRKIRLSNMYRCVHQQGIIYAAKRTMNMDGFSCVDYVSWHALFSSYCTREILIIGLSCHYSIIWTGYRYAYQSIHSPYIFGVSPRMYASKVRFMTVAQSKSRLSSATRSSHSAGSAFPLAV